MYICVCMYIYIYIYIIHEQASGDIDELVVEEVDLAARIIILCYVIVYHSILYYSIICYHIMS